MKKHNVAYCFPMNSRALRIIVVLFISASLYQCSAALYMPQVSDAEKAGTTLDVLVTGRKLYVGHCGSCHSLFLPEQFTSEQWTKSMGKMQGEAHISDEERDLIVNYLNTKCRN